MSFNLNHYYHCNFRKTFLRDTETQLFLCCCLSHNSLNFFFPTQHKISPNGYLVRITVVWLDFFFFFWHLSLHFAPLIVLPESLSTYGILSSFSVKRAEAEIKCYLFCLHTSQFSSKHIMIGPKWFLPEIQAYTLNEITRGDWQEGV